MKKSGDEDFEKGRKKTPVDSTGVLMSIYDFEICRKKCDKLFVTFFLRFLGNEKSELVAFSEGAISRQPLKI